MVEPISDECISDVNNGEDSSCQISLDFLQMFWVSDAIYSLGMDERKGLLTRDEDGINIIGWRDM